MIQWSTVKSAVRAWVRTGSGLPDGQVIWHRQAGPRPTSPYITIGLSVVARVGQDHKAVEDAAAPAPGAEIQIVLRGLRELALTLTCFGGDAIESAGRLEDVRTAQRLPTVHLALIAAGVGVARFGSVLPIDGQLGAARFEPRAVMEVRGYVSSQVSELNTYIQRAVIEDEQRDRTFTVDIDP